MTELADGAPGSICLFRLSALGDVCHCIPAVRALRRRFPDASLTWIIGSGEHRLVEDLDGVEFVVVAKRDGWRAFPRLRRALDGKRQDVLLVAQVSARANLLSLAVPARRRIGFDRERSREGHGLVVHERIPAAPGQHQALALQSFAAVLGADPGAEDRAPPVPEAARAFARSHLEESGRAVLISPCSSHPGRNWRPERYAAVADWVIGEAGRPVVLIGGPTDIEREAGAAIERAMRARPLNLIGRDTLKQSLAMLERAACLVAPDSGPVHFADALGTPVIGLYAATWSRRSGPLASLEHCVDRFPEAAERFLGKPPEKIRWGRRIEVDGVMDLVEVRDVVARLERLLGRGH